MQLEITCASTNARVSFNIWDITSSAIVFRAQILMGEHCLSDVGQAVVIWLVELTVCQGEFQAGRQG